MSSKSIALEFQILSDVEIGFGSEVNWRAILLLAAGADNKKETQLSGKYVSTPPSDEDVLEAWQGDNCLRGKIQREKSCCKRASQGWDKEEMKT